MIFLSFSKHFNELSFTFLVILPLPIPEVFNCNSFNLNEFLLIQSGGVELNPSPKKSFSLTLFHWNLNGTATHDFEKVYLIQLYALPYSTDIIFLPLRPVTLILIFKDIFHCVLIIHQV